MSDEKTRKSGRWPKGVSGNPGGRPARLKEIRELGEQILHAKIGELTLENDFLEGALTKAGLLSAKR